MASVLICPHPAKPKAPGYSCGAYCNSFEDQALSWGARGYAVHQSSWFRRAWPGRCAPNAFQIFQMCSKCVPNLTNAFQMPPNCVQMRSKCFKCHETGLEETSRAETWLDRIQMQPVTFIDTCWQLLDQYLSTNGPTNVKKRSQQNNYNCDVTGYKILPGQSTCTFLIVDCPGLSF